MTEPLSHIADCQGMRYRTQLNAYKYLIEKYYDKQVLGMFVVCTHPDNDGIPFIDNVPDMSDEIDDIMEIQRMRVREIRSMSGEDDRSCDPLGGALAMDHPLTLTPWSMRKRIQSVILILLEKRCKLRP